MTRRLAAILAADIIGYSKLMGEDEAGTLAALRRLRSEVFSPAVASKRGKIIKSMGDGWLVAFNSAEDAVTCAMHVQDRLTTDPTIKLRIGVDTGDVVHQDEDVFGDDVNIAARLEEISPHGGVAISDAVWGALDGTLKPSFDDQGEKALKNIAHPVRVWARGGDVAGGFDAKFEAGFPNLAIVPIETSSDDAEVQELAAAITSDLATYLGAVQWINAETSAEPAPNAYIAQGALRARGGRIRLEVTLSAPNGQALWREKYESLIEDSFDWQDQTSRAISTNLFGHILQREELRIETTPEDQRTAEQWHNYALLRSSQDAAGLIECIQCMERAIELAPNWGHPYVMAVAALFSATSMGLTKGFEPFIAKQAGWFQKADELEPKASSARAMLAFAHFVQTGDRDAARGVTSQLLKHLPFDPDVLMFGRYLFLYAGEPQPGLDCLRKLAEIGLHTPYSAAVHNGIAFANVQLGLLEDALDHSRKALAINPTYPATNRHLAAIFVLTGDAKAAAEQLKVFNRLIPDETISKIRERVRMGDTEHALRYLEGLRLAGMPE